MGKTADSTGLGYIFSKIKNLFKATVSIQDDNIDLSTTPSTGIYDRGIEFTDANGDVIGFVQLDHETDGNYGIAIGANSADDSVTNQIALEMNGTTPKIWVSQPATFRTAIGANSASNLNTGTLPAARLPTATTSALGGVKVDGSTITISNGVISASGGGYDLDADITSRGDSQGATRDGAVWWENGSGEVSIMEVIPLGSGGTGSTTVSGARTNLDVYSKSEIDTHNSRIGGYFTAAWSASSSSANNTQLTGKTSALSAGVYLVEVQYPVLSTSTFTASLTATGGTVDSNRYILGGNYSHAAWVVTVGSGAQLYLQSSQSASCTFTYTARGWLRATRLRDS